jgi:glutathione S-transferase
MRVLYHYILCPLSRKVRLTLAEKKLDFSLEQERYWEKRPAFLQINPAGDVPVLIDLNGSTVCGAYPIIEYLEEAYPERSLIGETLTQKVEVRRLMGWFDDKFARDVTMPLVMEKNLRRYMSGTTPFAPNSHVIRTAQAAINPHLDYIAWLIDRRNWLAGEQFSLADITAAAHLSIIDYLGDVPWDKHPLAKEWYMRIKSRPTFRALLQDRVPGTMPSIHYPNLDF